jgi:hypothetical protein
MRRHTQYFSSLRLATFLYNGSNAGGVLAPLALACSTSMSHLSWSAMARFIVVCECGGLLHVWTS